MGMKALGLSALPGPASQLDTPRIEHYPATPATMARTATYLRGVRNFVCGQLVSLFSLLALVMAKRLVYRDVNTPVFLNLWFYLFLSVVSALCNCIVTSKDGSPSTNAMRGTVKWWVYPLLAIIDLQANVCAATALQYTSFATTGLALNLAVPFVFILSVCAFRASYKWQHCVGCLVTLAGGVVLLVACYDRQSSKMFGSENEVYGWSLAVLSAMLYAGSTTINQWCTQQRGVDRILESLAKIGAWSALFCVIEVVLVERTEILAIEWDSQIVLLFTGYVLCMFAFYMAVFMLVEATESTLYNLALLCSSVYLMLLARHSLDESVDATTKGAAMTMLIGLTLYTMTREPVAGSGNGSTTGLPQISFKSMHTPRELVPNKLQMAQV